MFNSRDLSQIRELMRRMENLLRYATVHEVDVPNARLKAIYADGTTSGWLPAFSQRAGDSISWHFPDIGERVMILSPSGEPSGGIALCGIYTDTKPHPSQDHDLHLMQYPNGDSTSHHRQTGDAYQKISGQHLIEYSEKNSYLHKPSGETIQKIEGLHHIEYGSGSFIQADANGNLVLNFTGNITIQASGNMVLKASKIYEN
ncbi:phage baseplate assembly protein V [Thiomicrorhabdus sp.]|uniref:phage baseplate assembly protein V n=1 Tax=Thiomicrorhabdus sp. TaxID=2039724 RepID=UPI0029C7DB4A|nr:phage baseplate assembly protein V [Thiomicrorhabdus sp.]